MIDTGQNGARYMTETPETGRKEPYTRKDAALLLSSILEKMDRRMSAARFRTRESDSEYLAFVRATVQAIGALNQVIKDEALDQFDERLKILEAGR